VQQLAADVPAMRWTWLDASYRTGMPLPPIERLARTKRVLASGDVRVWEQPTSASIIFFFLRFFFFFFLNDAST
jgi:hypothetical protein